MAKYKIGDKVKIRDDLELNVDYRMCDGTLGVEINREMKNEGGTIATIKGYDNNGRYLIEEDCWHWTDEMFSEISESTKKCPVSDLKVGDMVRVRADLKEDVEYFGNGRTYGIEVNDEMVALKNSIVTIKKVNENDYHIEEDNEWYWTDEMFSEKIEIKTKPPFKAGDKVLVRKDLEKGGSYVNVSTSDYDMVTGFMLNLCGKVCTIERVLGGKYKLIEDVNNYSWTEEMFVLDEYPSKKIEKENKEDKPSLLEFQIEHQHDIPKRLFYLAEKYPNVTWKKAKEYYTRVVDNVILGAGEENLFSGSLSFGRGLSDAAARFEELLKLEEKAVSLKSTAETVATFERFPVLEGEISKPVSDDEKTSKEIDCFNCASADCTNCKNFKYKMAII